MMESKQRRPDAAERHRQRVKQRYHHTLKSLEEARQQVQQLTLRHHSALERQRSLLAETQTNGSPSEAQQETMRLYVEATDLVVRLIKAKDQLQQEQDATDQAPLAPVRTSVG